MTAKILVVDDDRDLVESMKTYLEARGYGVATAASGDEARAEIERELPDLVVTDIMMDHDTDGFNLAHRLKREPATQGIPVIIVSGFTKELDTKTHIFEPMMYEEWPAAKFFEKPLKLSALVEAIGELLAPGAARAQGQNPAAGEA